MMPYMIRRSSHHAYRPRRAGLGDSTTAAQGVQIGSSVGAPVASAVAGPGVATALGISTSLAVPLIGAAIAGATIAITLLIKNSGCGQTCIETSQWANQAEPVLRQNIQAYFSNSTRTQSMQAAALANFDAVWARLVQMCSDPSTGNAGKKCISDRQSGACTWKQTSTSPLLSIPREPQVGACWNWFSGYRDPIQNDTAVVPDASAAGIQGDITSAASSLGISPLLLLAGAGLLIALVAS